MSYFNPIQLSGGVLTPVNQALPQLPFSPNILSNLLPSLATGNANQIAKSITSLTLGGIGGIQSPSLPSKKPVTFLLKQSNGQLAIPNNPSYQRGYQFDMLINPSNLTINYPAKTVNTVRTMGGWILQHWFPELGSLTGEGIIGNLLESFNNDTKDTTAWSAFKKLIQIYQSNGVAYQPNNVNRNAQTFLPRAECHYDGFVYKGYFESFNYTEDQEQPWTRKYNFTFKFTDLIDTNDIVALTQQNNTNNSVATTIQSVVSVVNNPVQALVSASSTTLPTIPKL